jgi:hypothetical protein
MATPLENCTREEQRSAIRFLWSEGVKPSEIHRRMIQQYGGSCMSERKVYQWVERFQEGRTSVIDEHRSGKLMLVLFWDMNGPILEHYQEKGETVNSVRYSIMLEEKPKPAIRSRCCGLLSKGTLLLRHNARPHNAAAIVTTLKKLKFETINHPPYSPDLTPSNYHVFDTLKEALRG